MLEDGVELELVLAAVVEEDDGGEGDRDVEVADDVHELLVLLRVLVVAREEAVVVPAALLRVQLAEVPLVAGPQVEAVRDDEAHQQVEDAHFYEDEVHRSARVQQKLWLSCDYCSWRRAIT